MAQMSKNERREFPSLSQGQYQALEAAAEEKKLKQSEQIEAAESLAAMVHLAAILGDL